MKSNDLDKRCIITLVAALVFALLFFYMLITSSANRVADPEDIKSKIGHMGEVLDYQVIPSTGLTAWKIKPDGLERQFIFYTTANGKALLTGSIWDSESGTEISSGVRLVQEAMLFNQEAGLSEANAVNPDGSPVDAAAATQAANERDMSFASTDGNGEALGEYKDETPIVFNLLDKMKGFKTAEASATDTVYMFYDPRCPVCKEAFNQIDQIDLKAKNIAVKWLPTTALGNNEDGRQRAAVAFQTKDYSDFSASINGTKKTDKVSDDELQYLIDNLHVLKTSAEETYGKDYEIKVPAAIYMNKVTGTPKLLFGITDPKALKTIFGE